MLIRLQDDADPRAVERSLAALGLWVRPLVDADGVARALLVEPLSPPIEAARVMAVPGVAGLLHARSPHPRVDAQAGRPVVFGPAVAGGDRPLLIAGPCSVDAEDTVHAIAAMAAAAGARALRGGAFKPRTSPYSFDGHGHPALGWMRAAADRNGLAMVTEVLSEHEVDAVAEVADLVQIGSRNMQNFALLRAVGATGRPTLLKRGMSATVEEWLLAGEHLLAAGASGVIFCERGLRSFDPGMRNLLDLAAVALLKHAHGQPVVVDPSHATGRRDLVLPLALAARAAGADGVMVEAHVDPTRALSDGPQAIDGEALRALGRGLGLVAPEAQR
ncbi:MAG: 3-deoxy-7-phosphoheptulonate synthase [Myxococcales bacterium]|nr:3-deoxy-7-phosphoheptulonate synthase [Myxococcales bacterium]